MGTSWMINDAWRFGRLTVHAEWGRRMTRTRIAIAVSILPAALAGCSPGPAFDDPTAEYTQRTMLVSSTGGDAQAANTVVQTATPWPRYSNDTNIPGEGTRMTKAVQRYEDGAAGGGASGSTSTTAGASANGASSASTMMGYAPAAPPPQ